ncbi:hypothetical protein [Streptomyces sp. NPDC002962]|uniref:hypothetical protein n=1 Tax=Streptomyces sp. NPDC002962 TaxID=3364674 RepID=UPI0036CFA0A8
MSSVLDQQRSAPPARAARPVLPRRPTRLLALPVHLLDGPVWPWGALFAAT